MSCAALIREHCEKCDEATVHDSVGCIHCRSPRRPPPVIDVTRRFKRPVTRTQAGTFTEGRPRNPKLQPLTVKHR